MSHLDYTIKSKKGQHLRYEERQKIEILFKAGHKPEEIGRLLGGRSKRTIQREIALGKVKLLNSDLTYRIEYSADAAQKKRDYNNTAKGPRLKLGANIELIRFIEEMIIKHKFSPSAALAEARKKGYDVIVVNTICNATEVRQKEAREIAQRVDIMIVIGGTHSSNTRKLYEICQKECERTYFIQTLDDLHLEIPKSVKLVGITAGASTPNNIIEEVQNYVRINF